MSFSINGNVVDILNRKIVAAQIIIEDKKIHEIKATHASVNPSDPYILPGFVDSHVHIESSMLIPSEFARLAVVHGTVATVSDPHEIANVCGIEGVRFMIQNGKTVPFKFNFGAPSCVPATTFETAGAVLAAAAVEQLLKQEEIKYLSEMMNFPGVLHGDEEVMKKIAAAHRLGKPVDGHAPGLRGEAARHYIAAGISTDHECFTREEALDKLQHGMKIIIREGSAAKNFEALIGLLQEYPGQMMFCSDDKHPDSLVEGHINQLCARAVAKGIDVFKVLQAACINPVHHYRLEVGLLQKGDAADFIVVQDLENFIVLQTYINGEQVAENGVSKIKTNNTPEADYINNFNCSAKAVREFAIKGMSDREILSCNWLREDGYNGLRVPVIEALDGQLITNKIGAEYDEDEQYLNSNVEDDILKIAVVNRYQEAPVAKAFIKNFGLKRGAIASSVAHDSHNIVAVGVDDESLCRAVNLVVECKGGISCVDLTPGPSPGGEESREAVLALPVAGLMSAEDGYKVAKEYAAMDARAKALGSTLSAPFMTLSFMALLVIPHLKLSDKGLFDGDEFRLL